MYLCMLRMSCNWNGDGMDTLVCILCLIDKSFTVAFIALHCVLCTP